MRRGHSDERLVRIMSQGQSWGGGPECSGPQSEWLMWYVCVSVNWPFWEVWSVLPPPSHMTVEYGWFRLLTKTTILWTSKLITRREVRLRSPFKRTLGSHHWSRDNWDNWQKREQSREAAAADSKRSTGGEKRREKRDTLERCVSGDDLQESWSFSSTLNKDHFHICFRRIESTIEPLNTIDTPSFKSLGLHHFEQAVTLWKSVTSTDVDITTDGLNSLDFKLK